MARPTFAEFISRAIKAEMAWQGITQAQLAERLGWGQTTVSRKLLGRRPLEVSDVEHIAEVLGVEITQLGWPTNKSPRQRRAS
jgi:transcriptional regulator with XRE-family HTH domain